MKEKQAAVKSTTSSAVMTQVTDAKAVDLKKQDEKAIAVDAEAASTMVATPAVAVEASVVADNSQQAKPVQKAAVKKEKPVQKQ